jgi:GNAT superfamily N-acetyltransferase
MCPVERIQVQLRAVTEAEALATSVLVQASFTRLAAPEWEPSARDVFMAESTPEALAAKIKCATCATGAFSDRQLVGFLLMPTPALLGMLFVHPECLRRGIGRALWEHARAYVESTFSAVKTIELNATPCAYQFYRSIGFAPISAEYNREGCRATRMACWLPARALRTEVPM